MNWFQKLFIGPSQIWGGAQRSSGWDKVRNEHIKKQPVCCGCNASSRLEAHHIIPFHFRPDLELEPGNLITLCRDCHWNIGHLRDWSLCNPCVVEDAETYLRKFLEARRK